MGIEQTFHFNKTCHGSARIFLPASAEPSWHEALKRLSIWGGSDAKQEIGDTEFSGYEVELDLGVSLAKMFVQRRWQHWNWSLKEGWRTTDSFTE